MTEPQTLTHECKEPSGVPTVPPGPVGQPTPLEPEHGEACLALDRLCLGGFWSAGQWNSELADPQRPGLGLWRNGELQAMACGWLVVDELHITLLAVDPNQRRQGLARALVRALLASGHSRGALRATLEVGSGNGPAVALYRSLGFVDAGIRRGYYRTGEDALVQWLDLTTGPVLMAAERPTGGHTLGEADMGQNRCG
jgi:[ribosomal protein S18]-alanine N-acetyltransferase